MKRIRALKERKREKEKERKREEERSGIYSDQVIARNPSGRKSLPLNIVREDGRRRRKKGGREYNIMNIRETSCNAY